MTQVSVRGGWAALLVAVVSVAAAQGGPPAATPGPSTASAPGSGIGPGQGGMRGWRMNRQNTPGWSLMTPQEREAHYSTMRAMKTYDECRAYMEQHHAQLAERAKAKGATLPLRPRRDPCERLKR